MQQRQCPQLNIQEEEQFQSQEQQYQQQQQYYPNQYAQYNNPDQVFTPTIVDNQYPQYQNNIYQPILPVQNQAPSYPINYDIIEPIVAKQNQISFKYLDFIQQRQFLLAIMGLFFLWSSLYILLMVILLIIFAQSMYNYNLFYQILFGFSIIGLVFSQIVGIQYRKQSKYIYFITIIFYTLTHFSLVGSIATENTDELSLNIRFAIIYFLAQGTNFVTTAIMLFYLFIEKKGIVYQKFIGLVIFIFAIPLMEIYDLAFYFFFFLILAIPYLFLLPHSLIQITKGRFQLEKDQIFTGALAANLGLYVCCYQKV